MGVDSRLFSSVAANRVSTVAAGKAVKPGADIAEKEGPDRLEICSGNGFCLDLPCEVGYLYGSGPGVE